MTNLSPHISYVIYVTNMSYAFVTNKYGQLLTGPALLDISVLYWCQFKEYFCGVNINQLKL